MRKKEGVGGVRRMGAILRARARGGRRRMEGFLTLVFFFFGIFFFEFFFSKFFF